MNNVWIQCVLLVYRKSILVFVNYRNKITKVGQWIDSNAHKIEIEHENSLKPSSHSSDLTGFISLLRFFSSKYIYHCSNYIYGIIQSA